MAPPEAQDTWQAARDSDGGGKVVRSQQIRRFVEIIIGKPFADYVEERKPEGSREPSFDDIAFELTLYLHSRLRALGLPEDIKVSGETVRRWYGLPR